MCTFRELRLGEDKFQKWLVKCDDVGLAKCVLCPEDFSIRNEDIARNSSKKIKEK